MRAPPPVTLSPRERAELVRWTRGRSVPVRRVERARIVLLAAEGRTNQAIAKLLRLSPVTVRRWRSRFALLGMTGISEDAPRSGHKNAAGSPSVAVILERTRLGRPTNGVRWTTRTLGRELGVSHTTIGRVWRSSGVRPPRYRPWRLSVDPRYLDRRIDVAGIYVNPPGTLLALSIEPRSGALGLSTHSTSRMGRTIRGSPTLETTRPVGGADRLAETLGALDAVPVSTAPWRLTSRELLLFLESVDSRAPPLTEIHLLTGASSVSHDDRVLRWIDRHPRFHLASQDSDRPISSVVRDWFEPQRASRSALEGLPTLPLLERLLGGHLKEVTLFGRPFAWTRSGAVSHWRNSPSDAFSRSSKDSVRISARARSRSA